MALTNAEINERFVLPTLTTPSTPATAAELDEQWQRYQQSLQAPQAAPTLPPDVGPDPEFLEDYVEPGPIVPPEALEGYTERQRTDDPAADYYLRGISPADEPDAVSGESRRERDPNAGLSLGQRRLQNASDGIGQALNNQADAEVELGRQDALDGESLAQLNAEHDERERAIDARANEAAQRHIESIGKLTEEASVSVDPTRFWSDGGSYHKAAGFIAAFLGGFTGQSQSINQIIDNAVQRDIDAQKDSRKASRQRIEDAKMLNDLGTQQGDVERGQRERSRISMKASLLGSMKTKRATLAEGAVRARVDLQIAEVEAGLQADLNREGQIQHQNSRQAQLDEERRQAQKAAEEHRRRQLAFRRARAKKADEAKATEKLSGVINPSTGKSIGKSIRGPKADVALTSALSGDIELKVLAKRLQELGEGGPEIDVFGKNKRTMLYGVVRNEMATILAKSRAGEGLATTQGDIDNAAGDIPALGSWKQDSFAGVEELVRISTRRTRAKLRSHGIDYDPTLNTESSNRPQEDDVTAANDTQVSRASSRAALIESGDAIPETEQQTRDFINQQTDDMLETREATWEKVDGAAGTGQGLRVAKDEVIRTLARIRKLKESGARDFLVIGEERLVNSLDAYIANPSERVDRIALEKKKAKEERDAERRKQRDAFNEGVAEGFSSY